MEHVRGKRREIKARHDGRVMPLYMVACWETGRAVGSRMYKLAFLGILVVGRLQTYTSGLPQFGYVAAKSTSVHHEARNDTAISSVVHQVG